MHNGLIIDCYMRVSYNFEIIHPSLPKDKNTKRKGSSIHKLLSALEKVKQLKSWIKELQK